LKVISGIVNFSLSAYEMKYSICTVLRISGIASHFAPQIQANAMQQHFRIALKAMQNNAQIIALSSANLRLKFGSDQRLDYCR